jgi:hypothetical protein
MSCDAPMPMITALNITPAAAPARRPARTRPPRSGNATLAGIPAKLGSIKVSRSRAAIDC